MKLRYYFIDQIGRKIYITLLAWIWNDQFVYAANADKPEQKYHIYRTNIKTEEITE